MIDAERRTTQPDSSTSIDEKIPNGLDTRLRVAVDFGASFAISGILAIVFRSMIAPIERVKLILQTQASSRQIEEGDRKAYSGVVNALVRIPKEQGFFSLWRGNLLNISRYFPAQAINFSFYDLYYEAFRKMIESRTVHSDAILPFLTGAAVGLTSCTLMYPLSFCNTRISVDVGDSRMIKREFYGLNDCLGKIYRSDGYKGFYQGLLPAACGLALYRSIYFGVYTIGKQTYSNNSVADAHTSNAPFFVSLALAQSASIIATMLTYPFDTTSKQKMLWTGRGSRRYASLRQVVGKMNVKRFKGMGVIARKDGPVGFYRGVSANLMTTVCGSLLLVTYDIIKGHFDRLTK